MLGSAVIQFISTPPDEWKVLEGQNITFIWRYSFDGTIVLAKFTKMVTSSYHDVIARNYFGTTIVVPSFQQRFTANISVTQANITMLAVQRSDQGKYEFDITTSNFETNDHEVELIVQCK